MRYLGKGSVSSFLRVLIDIAWWLCLAIAAAMVAAGAYVFVWGLTGGSPARLSVDAGALRITFPAGVGQTAPMIVGFVGLALVGLGFALAVIHQLRRIFSALSAGTPFTMENARRIRTIGWLAIAGTVMQSLVNVAIALVIMNSVTIPGVTFSTQLNLSLGGVFAGLVILVLAEIFKHGADMQGEQDLTV